MGKVTLDFVGLFLFNSNANDPAELRIAVIDADRDHVRHGDKDLTRHKASFTAENVVRSSTDWPLIDKDRFELAGSIAFETSETSASLDVRLDRWALPRIATGCPDLRIDDSFFQTPKRDATHAVITVRSGEFCSWRYSLNGERKGAINTRVTISDPKSFVITRADGKHIVLDVEKGSSVVFCNTELTMTQDDYDWYWYYVATGQECAPDPDDSQAVFPCEPLEDNPLSLGCSNSQWP